MEKKRYYVKVVKKNNFIFSNSYKRRKKNYQIKMQNHSPNYTNVLEPRKNDIENIESPSNQLIDIQETGINVSSNSLFAFNKNINTNSFYNDEKSEFSLFHILNNSVGTDVSNNNFLFTVNNFILENDRDIPQLEIGNIQINNTQQIIPKPESQVKEEKNLLGKKRGRKKKDDKSERDHDKYKEDNMSLKSKTIFKNDLLAFINSKIKPKNFSFVINYKLYSGDEVKLLNITDKNFKNTNVDYNKKLLNTEIKDIWIDEISGKFKKYPKNYNDEIIKNIYNSENGEDIKEIFDKTYLECLKYYRKDEDIYGKKDYACMSGLEKGFQDLEKSKEDNKNDQQYVEGLIELMKNFENVYSRKIHREKGKKDKQKN